MRRTSLALLAILSALVASNAGASTVVAMNLEQMTDRAETIFVGRVAGTRADWNADRTRIYTYVTLEVDHYLKGGGGAAVQTVRLLGGRVGPFLARVPGMPQFAPGEEVFLFCAGGGARLPTVLGMSLGKFTIARDDSGETIVERDISSLMLANYRTDSRQPGDPVNRYRLADLEARVQGYLR